MSKKKLGTLAIDQHGNTYHDLGKFPRKTLLEQLGRTRAEKMYVDTNDGQRKHVGYIIGGLWLQLYYVSEWAKMAGAS